MSEDVRRRSSGLYGGWTTAELSKPTIAGSLPWR